MKKEIEIIAQKIDLIQKKLDLMDKIFHANSRLIRAIYWFIIFLIVYIPAHIFLVAFFRNVR